MKPKNQTSKTLSVRISNQQSREIQEFATAKKLLVADLVRNAVQQFINDKRTSDELAYLNARMEQIERNLSQIKDGQAGLKDNLSTLCDLVQGVEQ